MPIATQSIQASTFHEANPESSVFAHLADEDRNQKADWWAMVREDYASGTISPAEAVAAYIIGIRPLREPEFESAVVEQATRIQPGEQFASLTYGFGGLNRDLDIDRAKSGVVEGPVIALLGHPRGRLDDFTQMADYPGVGIGVRLTNREDMLDFDASQLLGSLVGSEDIVTAFEESVSQPLPSNKRYLFERRRHVVRRLNNLAFMRTSGIGPAYCAGEYAVEKDLLLDETAIIQELAAKQQREEFHLPDEVGLAIKTVSALYVVEPAMADDLIISLADHHPALDKDHHQQLVNAIAETRAPFVLESMSHLAQLAMQHEAIAEIYRLQDKAHKARVNAVSQMERLASS